MKLLSKKWAAASVLGASAIFYAAAGMLNHAPDKHVTATRACDAGEHGEEKALAILYADKQGKLLNGELRFYDNSHGKKYEIILRKNGNVDYIGADGGQETPLHTAPIEVSSTKNPVIFRDLPTEQQDAFFESITAPFCLH